MGSPQRSFSCPSSFYVSLLRVSFFSLPLSAMLEVLTSFLGRLKVPRSLHRKTSRPGMVHCI